jgi:predicted ATPase/GAF domain-containing protein
VREADGLPVTLKILFADHSRVADIAHLKHEYGRIARVASPRVIHVHDVLEHEDRLVLVLSRVRERDLQSLLDAHARKGLPADDFLDRAIAMAEAVGELHRHALIHAGLSPTSVLFGEDGSVKLWNFGIDATVTRENEAIYSEAVLSETLPYISPEQTGRMNRAVDQRTDLYALGVLFYEMLSGRRPFSAADPMELIHAHIALTPAALPPGVPSALGDITRKLLSKDADDRYQSAAGLLADLKEIQRLRREGVREEGFPVGRWDRSNQLQLRQKLYGREGDIRALTASFEGTLSGRREIVLVSGYSGTGKSSLVQEILRPLARERGYYVSGKYGQYNRDKPLSALIQAFEALLRQLLTESEARLARWRATILGALGNNAEVVCDILPSLKLIIGEPAKVPALEPLDSQNRFNLTFRRFVSAFARHAHPLAIFLDDLQWIDSASLSLLKSVLADDKIDALFFCGAYRDNEVNAAHPLIRDAFELERGGLPVRRIVLLPLDLDHLTELIQDSLGAFGARARALAEVVLRKTGGNPFFVKQLLKSLHDRGQLTFNPDGGWRWDLAEVEAQPYTNNVVDLMLDTLRVLPKQTQDMLKLASVIGDRFTLSLISAASDCSPDAAYARLAPALEQGLIDRVSDKLRFAHDKIQEAARSMVPAAERAQFHYRIGKLLESARHSAEGPLLFDVVNHLNSAGDLVHDRSERVKLARLNLEAAEQIEEAGAFHAALLYLEQGIARLPEDAWGAEYALALALTMKRGQMESLNAQPEPALATLAHALSRASGKIDQTAVHRLRMRAQILNNDLPAALDEGLRALRLFAIDLPAFPSEEDLERELAATFAELGGRSMEFLSELPRLADREVLALQGLLEELWLPAYLLNSKNFGISVMKILQSSIRHGVSRSTVHALLNFGTFLCTGVDIERGYACGRAAVRLNERYPDKQIEPMLCNMWCANIQHWKEPYAVSRETFLRGIQAGVERGQYAWAFYNIKNSTVSNLLRGVNLQETLAELSSNMPICKLDAANAVTWMAKAIGQICHNLTQPTEASHRLEGEWVDIEPIVAEARGNNQVAVLVADFYRIFLSVFMDACDEIAETAYVDDPSIPAVASWFGHPAFQFYAGVALTRACDGASAEVREKYLRKAQRSLSMLEGWSAMFPDNLLHRARLLSAEIARVMGDAGIASARYDEGIAAAREGRFLQDEALGNELCARHYMRLGKTTIARAYMTEAYLLYGRWGASEVMRRLERDFSALLYQRDPPKSRGLGDAPALPGAPSVVLSGSEIDLSSVLKASQAISGEIVLSSLLEKLMRIILENAGARRGFLILKEEGRLLLEAEGDLGKDRVRVLQSVPLSSRADLSANIIHYVARAGESVVIGDAAAEAQFADDVYVKQYAPKSILAAPLLSPGRVRGVIYLENDLTTHAFTEARVELLRLLASQIAISIENALVYTQLEEKVSARTAELQAANAEIRALSVAQQRTIRALSTPIIQVWDGVLAIPVIGALTNERAADMMQSLLARIASSRARVALIDLTGVDEVDEATAGHLVRLVGAVELLGARAIITGLRPAVAQTMVSLDVDVGGLTTYATLRDALQVCTAPRARRHS